MQLVLNQNRENELVGNKVKGRISKRVFQGVLCFFETPVLRFALLPYYQRTVSFSILALSVEPSHNMLKSHHITHSKTF